MSGNFEFYPGYFDYYVVKLWVLGECWFFSCFRRQWIWLVSDCKFYLLFGWWSQCQFRFQSFCYAALVHVWATQGLVWELDSGISSSAILKAFVLFFWICSKHVELRCEPRMLAFIHRIRESPFPTFSFLGSHHTKPLRGLFYLSSD